jgi:uncharacterized protein
MIQRTHLLLKVKDAIRRSPVTALTGPRQCGKTTLSKEIAKDFESVFFDLENPTDKQALLAAPLITLRSLEKLIIIDEIHHAPELLPIIRVLCDEHNENRKFLILGSASSYLVKSSSETLAGRIALIDMSGFGISEVGAESLKSLWLRGGFPLSFLADDQDSFKWRLDFVRTFLERDIPQLGINIPSESLRRFWVMLSHYHGNIWNAAEFARSLSTSEPTARKYLDILSGALVVRQLQPWHENIAKRQVRSPKVYIRDTGLLHALLMLEDKKIMEHPKLGASWEGFVIEQLSLLNDAPLFFWATHAGSEIDIITIVGGKRVGVEIKYGDAPAMTKSIKLATDDLNLYRVYVIYPGDRSYFLNENTKVIPAKNMDEIFTG